MLKNWYIMQCFHYHRSVAGLVTTACHGRCCGCCVAFEPLPANAPGTSVGDGLGSWVPATRVGDLVEFLAPGLGMPLFRLFRHLRSETVMEELFFPFSLSKLNTFLRRKAFDILQRLPVLL